jgi:REP element-mobilizing transposase RayT
MPRKLRNITQGKTHHCFTRCHAKRNLLKTGYGRKYFIEAIKKCQEKYEFNLIAAEPVGNHIHLIIQTIENHETGRR